MVKYSGTLAKVIVSGVRAPVKKVGVWEDTRMLNFA